MTKKIFIVHIKILSMQTLHLIKEKKNNHFPLDKTNYFLHCFNFTRVPN